MDSQSRWEKEGESRRGMKGRREREEGGREGKGLAVVIYTYTAPHGIQCYHGEVSHCTVI